MDTTKLKDRMAGKLMELARPETIPTPLGAEYAAFGGNTLEIIRDNLKAQALTPELFDVVKSPSGGATVFAVPGLNGEDSVKELTGIVLDYATPRAYWDTPDPVEGTPPVCMSENSIISSDGKPCARCHCNVFGSKDGETNAKACKESVLLYLLRPNNILPLLVRVPVTSKGRFLKYAARLAGTLTPVSGVVTRISLEKATSKSGKPYALYNFEAVRALSADEYSGTKAYAQQFMELVSTAAVFSERTEAG